MFLGFEYEHARTLGEHKAVAVGVKRAAGLGRLCVAGAQGLHGGKGCHADRADGRLCAAHNHRINLAAPEAVQRVAHGVAGAGAGRGVGAGRAL